MDDRNATLYLSGMGFRIAESPEVLMEAGADAWNFPPHWRKDSLEAITEAWPASIGLAFETGGAVLFESLGEGVYQLVDSFPGNCEDLALKFQAALMFAFCATDCRRLLMIVDSEAAAGVAKQFGVYRYGIQAVGNGALYYLAAECDEWAAFVGHSVFHVEARRFGCEDKALRILERWARHSGDTTALDFSYLQGLDPAYWRVDAAQVQAVRAGFLWGHSAAHWIEHSLECGVPSGAVECTCLPTIGFTNGHQTATVQPGGEVSLAATH